VRVRFADGTEWSAGPPDAYRPVLEFLERKTGQRAVVARRPENLPTP
jgi:hypothetical protein